MQRWTSALAPPPGPLCLGARPAVPFKGSALRFLHVDNAGYQIANANDTYFYR
jgi:hypothetical protein